MSELTNEERIEKYAKKILEYKAQKEEIEEAEKNLRAKIAELTTNGDTFVGDLKINRRDNKRFDATLAKKNLTPEEFEKISISKPDSTLAKKLLDEDRYALTQKDFGAVITVGVRND